MALSWMEWEPANYSLAAMGYSAEPIYGGVLAGKWHLYWHGEHGRCCVGIVANPGLAMAGLAAANFPTSLPVGLCPICHPREES